MGCLAIFIVLIIVIVTSQNTILGAIIIICFAILFVIADLSNKKDLLKVKNIRKLKIEDIIDICNITKEEVGTSGYLNMMVAVDGFIKENDHSKDGLFYIEEYNPSNKTRIKKIRVKNNQFYIEDKSGQILIKTDKPALISDHNGKALLEEYKQTPNIEIIGHVDVGPIYIIGEASDKSGQLVIQKPKDFNNPFIISLTSEQEYVQQKENDLTSHKIVTICTILIGIIVLVIGIVK
jgi:hypothetical protein